MSVGERDKKMSELASRAAESFCKKHAPSNITEAQIQYNPEMFLEHTVPYITVRTLQRTEDALARHEKALKSMEADSRWIKILTFVLAGLTITLVYYAWRLDAVMHSLQETHPAATSSPTASPNK